MMMLFTLISSLALFTAIHCDFSHLYINQPNLGVSWRPGANVAIKWTPIGGELPPNAMLSIDVMEGDAQNANLVAHVGHGIPASANQYKWIVPVNMEQRSDYFIRMSSTDSSGVSYFYSGRYAVSGEAMGATLVSQPWEEATTSTAKPKPTSAAVGTTTRHTTKTTEHTATSLVPTSTSEMTSDIISSTFSKKESMTTSSLSSYTNTQTSKPSTSSQDDQSSANSHIFSSWVLISSATIFLSMLLIGAAV